MILWSCPPEKYLIHLLLIIVQTNIHRLIFYTCSVAGVHYFYENFYFSVVVVVECLIIQEEIKHHANKGLLYIYIGLIGPESHLTNLCSIVCAGLSDRQLPELGCSFTLRETPARGGSRFVVFVRRGKKVLCHGVGGLCFLYLSTVYSPRKGGKCGYGGRCCAGGFSF